MSMLKITLVKSTNRAKVKQVATIEALGLRKIGQSVLRQDNAATRGMIQKVSHLVSCEEE